MKTLMPFTPDLSSLRSALDAVGSYLVERIPPNYQDNLYRTSGHGEAVRMAWDIADIISHFALTHYLLAADYAERPTWPDDRNAIERAQVEKFLPTLPEGKEFPYVTERRHQPSLSDIAERLAQLDSVEFSAVIRHSIKLEPLIKGFINLEATTENET